MTGFFLFSPVEFMALALNRYARILCKQSSDYALSVCMQFIVAVFFYYLFIFIVLADFVMTKMFFFAYALHCDFHRMLMKMDLGKPNKT